MTRFEKMEGYPEEIQGRFNSFITTQFDDSLSVEMQIRSLIKWISSSRELINDIVDYMNLFIEMFDERLQEEIVGRLNEWLDDGTLAQIINNDVFDMKADKTFVDDEIERLDQKDENIITQLGQTEENLITQLNQKEENLITQLEENMQLIYPTGTENDSPMLNEKLSGGGRFLVKKGIYHIDENVELVSNTYLEFEQGAEFQKIPQESDHYRMIDVAYCDNVEIVNAHLIGERVEHLGVGGEWGYGLHIINSDNIVIKQPIITDTWGDGIYVGHDYYGENTKRTGNVYIINPYIDNVRRNGISVCGGENIVIDSPLIKNVNGTNPQADIDIEPESEPRISGTGVLPFLTNLTINNPITKNCKGSGITVLLDNLADRGLTTDININNHVDVGSQHGFRINRLSGKLGGSIKNKSPHYRNNQFAGIFFHGYKSTDTPTVEIENPTIEDFNRANYHDPYYYPAISVIVLPTDKYTYNVGNLIVTNPTFRNNLNVNRIRLFYFASGKVSSGQFVENIKILSPLEVVEAKGVTPIASNAKNFLITDTYNLIKDPNTTNSPKNVGENRYCLYSNKSATDFIRHELKQGVGVGNKVTFLVENSKQFRVRPPLEKSILPLGSVGQDLISNTVGSRLVLEELEDGNFRIIDMVGNWSAVDI